MMSAHADRLPVERTARMEPVERRGSSAIGARRRLLCAIVAIGVVGQLAWLGALAYVAYRVV
jgi:hypothetical protein